jgi:hypothetical protein
MENGTKLWATFPCQNFFTCYVGVVLHGLSSHVLLYLLHGHGASLQFFTCSPLIVNFCGGSLWFFTCSSLLVTWAWCFFAVLHMLSFNCKFLWWFFVVSHALLYLLHGCGASLQFFTCSPLIVHGCGGSLWFFTCSPLIVHGCVVLVVIGGSSHALLLLHLQCSSLLVHGCGCFVVLHMIFFFTCTWVLWQSILASCWDQTWHWFIPPVSWATKANCTSSQVVSFALTHTIGHINS